MRYLVVLVGLSILCGCSKKPQTLSGVYVGNFTENGFESKDSYDFRTDGTVVYKSATDMHTGLFTEEGQGTYTVYGDKVDASVVIVTLSKFTNQECFKMDGDDLIHIAKAEGGVTNLTNIEGIQPRFIKQR